MVPVLLLHVVTIILRCQLVFGVMGCLPEDVERLADLLNVSFNLLLEYHLIPNFLLSFHEPRLQHRKVCCQHFEHARHIWLTSLNALVQIYGLSRVILVLNLLAELLVGNCFAEHGSSLKVDLERDNRLLVHLGHTTLTEADKAFSRSTVLIVVNV